MPPLLPAWSDLRPFLPEAAVLATIVAVLLIPVFSPKKNSLGVGITSAIGLLAAIFFLLGIKMGPDAAAPGQVVQAGAAYFGGLLIMDPFGWCVKMAVLVFALIVVALWTFTTRDEMGPETSGDAPEFHTLLLSATFGILLMASTLNLLMMFIAIETASLPSYVLAGFKKNQRKGAEAALKYVLFGAVCSGVMLYAMSLIYGITGTLNLSQLAAVVTAGNTQNHAVLVIGMMGLLVGIGYKIAMVPMHFWAPDVFEGTHVDVAMFLSVASKAGGLAMMTRVALALVPGFTTFTWLPVALMIIGAVSCFWGNLSAFRQNNLKRLLAYSSIAHAGYMLLAISTVSGANPQRAAEALLFYLIAYVFMNGGAFVAVAAIAERIKSEDIRDYAGFGRKAPLLAASMVVFLFSLTGVPVAIGFGAKLKVLEVLFNTHNWIGYVGLGVLGANTVIAAFYYFRIIKAMYLQVPSDPQRVGVAEITPTGLLALALVVPNVLLMVGYNWVDTQSKAFSYTYAMPVEKPVILDASPVAPVTPAPAVAAPAQ